jgi:hypothetical protein
MVPGLARADDLARAQDLFAQARSLRSKGDCASAIPLFREALHVYPDGLGSVRNIAECEEALGHYAAAHRAWLDLGQALQTNHEARYEGWALDAEEGAKRLAPKVSAITIEVTGRVPPDPASSSLRVTVDGEPLRAAMLGIAIEHEPGRHVVRWLGDRSGRENERVVDLGVGDKQQIVIPLESPDSGVTAEPPRTSTPTSGSRALRVAGWSALGLGGASLIGAGAALIAWQHDYDDLPPCASTVCPESTKTSVQATVDHGRTAATLFNVFGAVGLGGVVVGATLLAIASPRPAKPAVSASSRVARSGIVILLTPNALEAQGRF